MSAALRYCGQCGGRLRWIRHRPAATGRCQRCGAMTYNNPIPSVEALVVRNSRVLMVKRHIRPKRGRWGFPGGFLERGETPAQGIIREIREELGATFVPRKLVGVYHGYYTFQRRQYSVVPIAFLGTLRGRIRIDHENDAVRWFPLNRLPTGLAFPHHIQVARDLRRIL